MTRLYANVRGRLLLVWGVSLLALLIFHVKSAEAHRRGKQEDFLLEYSAYGEMLYSSYNFGPDQKSSPNGSPPDYRTELDLKRLALELELHFDRSLFVEAEIEFEHGGTGASKELEYEEFGEYETEIEKGGEVMIEEFYLTKQFFPELEVSAGNLIVPIGLLYNRHLPGDYFTAARPESESAIIPSIWNELGIEAAGKYKKFQYKLQLVNGLDATGFSSRDWIAGGDQTKFESVKATDMAVAARLDYEISNGFSLGASAYRGNSTRNRPKPDMKGIDGYVTIGDLHGTFQKKHWTARGLLLYGSLQNADIISEKNSRLSTNLGVPRTPVAKSAMLWSAEVGHDITHLFNTKLPLQFIPFARAEYYNSMEDTDPGIFAQPRFKRTVLTGGLNLYYQKFIAVKADYSVRSFGSSQYRDENTFRLAVAFQTISLIP